MLNRLRRSLRALAALVVGTMLLSGCEFDVYGLPLPGGTDTGDEPITVTAEFRDVLDLVPKSDVKVNDVSVGQVKDLDLDGYTAVATLELRDDVDLPADTVASIRQTSLLGEKFVSLSPPGGGGRGELADGDVIPLERSGRNPEVEEVFGALSLVLNGGGIAQLKTITTELNTMLEGREGSARSFLRRMDTLTGRLDDNKGDIVRAMRKIDNLAVTLDGQMGTIDQALDELPSALRSIDAQRGDLVRMLKALNRLSNVGVRVINASKESMISTLELLEPTLRELANSGDDLVNAFHVFYSYPFIDEAVGRDPQVARNLHMGDYVNLSVRLDIDLSSLQQVQDLACTQLGALPEDIPLNQLPGDLCDGAVDAIDACLQDLQDGSVDSQACAQLPGHLVDTILGQAGEVCSELDQNLGGALGSLPGCEGDGGGGGGGPVDDLIGQLPLNGSNGGGGSDGDGGALGGLLRGQPGWTTTATPEITTEMMRQAYDPALVDLVMPGMGEDR